MQNEEKKVVLEPKENTEKTMPKEQDAVTDVVVLTPTEQVEINQVKKIQEEAIEAKNLLGHLYTEKGLIEETIAETQVRAVSLAKESVLAINKMNKTLGDKYGSFKQISETEIKLIKEK